MQRCFGLGDSGSSNATTSLESQPGAEDCRVLSSPLPLRSGPPLTSSSLSAEFISALPPSPSRCLAAAPLMRSASNERSCDKRYSLVAAIEPDDDDSVSLADSIPATRQNGQPRLTAVEEQQQLDIDDGAVDGSVGSRAFASLHATATDWWRGRECLLRCMLGTVLCTTLVTALLVATLLGSFVLHSSLPSRRAWPSVSLFPPSVSFSSSTSYDRDESAPLFSSASFVPEWAASCFPPKGAVNAGRWLPCASLASLCAQSAATNASHSVPLTSQLASCCGGATARHLLADGVNDTKKNSYVELTSSAAERASLLSSLGLSNASLLLDANNRYWSNAPFFSSDSDSQCDGASLRFFTPAEGRALLSNKRILFVGDSTSQELIFELIAWLEEAPADMDLDFERWTAQRACDGRHWQYQQRTITTALSPSPALSIFNISLHHLWNGHLDECENVGPMAQQRSNVLKQKLKWHATICANRSAHLDTLQTALRVPLMDLVTAHNDSLVRREQLFKSVRATMEPVNATYVFLEQLTAPPPPPPPPPPSNSSVPPPPPSPPSWAASSWSAHCPTVRSFDYIAYNAGLHLVPRAPWEQWYPDTQFLNEFEAVLAEKLVQLLELAVDGGAVLWKDSSSMELFPSLVRLNNIAHETVDRLNANISSYRQTANIAAEERDVYDRCTTDSGQQLLNRVLVWPVGYVLSGLSKWDQRHCSYKDYIPGNSFHSRQRHIRTHYCHAAVQLLLRTIAQHETQRQRCVER